MMIKVAARNRFSQKVTSVKSKTNQSKNNQNINTQEMCINGQNFHNFLNQFQSTKSCQHVKQKNNFLHIRKSSTNLVKNDQSNLMKQTRHRKNLSMKSPICAKNLLQNRNSQDFQNSIPNNQRLDTIKFVSHEKQQNQRSGRKSKTIQQNIMSSRSSAVKKTSNIAKKSELKKSNLLTKKVSIFNHQLGCVVNQSQHYEDFLKQSNVTQKPKSKETINQIHKFYENKENRFVLTEGHSKSYFQRQSFAKFHDENKNNLKKGGRVSKEYLFVKSSKGDRINTNFEQEIKKDSQNQKDLFKSFAQETYESPDPNTKKQKSIHIKEVTQNSQQNTLQKQETLKKAEKKKQIIQTKQKQETQQLFRILSREIASKKQMQKFDKKSQNFYEDLRIKMLKKYDMMMKDYRLDDREKEKISMLIQGCNLQKHRRVSNFGVNKKEIGHRRRPGTAGAIRQASKDIYRLNYAEKKRNDVKTRPSSCHPISTQEGYENYSVDRSSCMIPQYASNVSRLENDKKSSNNFSHDYSKSQCDAFFSMTNPDLKSISMSQNDYQSIDQIIYSKNQLSTSNITLTKKKSNKKLVQQKHILLNKFSVLMDICDGQSVQHVQTKKKMKVFEYYCSKVDNGFQKMSQKINNFFSHY